MSLAPRPMCLRIHRFLTPEEEIQAGLWHCRGRLDCPGGHDYRLATDDDEPKAIVDRALTFVESRFGDHAPRPITVWHSPGVDHPPESTRGLSGELAIYLVHTTREQGLFQAGHEAFHAIYTPIGVRHWVHEMLAFHCSLDFLADEGLDAYRRIVLETYPLDANAAGLDDLVRVDAVAFDERFYARLLLFGQSLIDLVGSERFFELRLSWDPGSLQPDYWAWLDALPEEFRSEVIAISPARPTI